MRRFLITSSKFAGTVEVVYKDDHLLCSINFSNAEIDAETIIHFKRSVAADINNFTAGFSGETTIVEADFELSLDDFKREYPYSRNYHLLDKLWSKMKKTDQVLAFFAAIEYRKYCERNRTWYKPKIAASWLYNNEFINDWKKM